MNQTNSSYYDYYNSTNYVFNSIGETATNDALYLFLITSVSLIGFILNIINLVVFNNCNLPDMPLYKYLNIYALNGIIVNFAYIFEFLSASFRYIPFATSYPAQVYYSFILIPIVSTGYFYSTVLDIIITMDRISCFSGRVKSIMIFTAYKTCAIAFILVFILNFPYFLIYEPRPFYNPKTLVLVGWLNNLTPFATSQIGIIFTFLVYVIRDLGLLVVEIILNFVSICFLRQHLKKRSRLLKKSLLKASAALPRAVLKPRKSILGDLNVITDVRQPDLIAEVIHKISRTRSLSVGSACKTTLLADRNSTLMTVCLSGLTLLDHCTWLTSTIFPYLSSNIYVYYFLSVLADLILTFKQASNFFVFFTFNKIFRQRVLKIFRHNNSN
jgi:ABC-type multidrug transport system fused ATPase/permease subunit